MIYRRIEQGLGRREAAEEGASQVTLAVISTTLALCAVFVPIAFLTGTVGQWFYEFGMVMAIAVCVLERVRVDPHTHAGQPGADGSPGERSRQPGPGPGPRRSGPLLPGSAAPRSRPSPGHPRRRRRGDGRRRTGGPYTPVRPVRHGGPERVQRRVEDADRYSPRRHRGSGSTRRGSAGGRSGGPKPLRDDRRRQPAGTQPRLDLRPVDEQARARPRPARDHGPGP